MPSCCRDAEHAFAGANCQYAARRRGDGEAAGRGLRRVLLALGCIALGGCAAVIPAPVVYAPPPKPAEHPKSVHRPAPKPAPPAAGQATPAAAPAAAPASDLPAAAQSPAELPPPGGLPHDPSEYIEPPAR